MFVQQCVIAGVFVKGVVKDVVGFDVHVFNYAITLTVVVSATFGFPKIFVFKDVFVVVKDIFVVVKNAAAVAVVVVSVSVVTVVVVVTVFGCVVVK